METIKRILADVLLAVAVVIVSCLVITGVRTGRPNVFGYRVFYIWTDSMEPAIKSGQLVLVQTVDAEDVEIGDIVAYDAGSEIIIHRVIGISDESYSFKGDNNSSDDEPVSSDQIMYKVVAY